MVSRILKLQPIFVPDSGIPLKFYKDVPKIRKNQLYVAEPVTHCATKLRSNELDIFLQPAGLKMCQGLAFPRRSPSARRGRGLPPCPKK